MNSSETGLDVIICARCGAENPTSAKFCARCWGLLHGPICPHCGKRGTRAGARYCEHCGRDLYAAPPAAPAEPIIAEPLEKLSAAAEVAEPLEKLLPAAEAAEPAVPPEKPVLREAIVLPENPSAPSKPPRRIGMPIALGAIAAAAVAVAFVSGLAIRRYEPGTGNPGTVPLPQRHATARDQPAAGLSPPDTSTSETPKPPAPASGGILKITTVPADAQVELDGRPVGVTDLTLSGVKPGRHMVKVSKTGFRAVSRDVEVIAGDTVLLNLTLAASLPPPVQRRRAPAAPPLPPPPLPPPPP